MHTLLRYAQFYHVHVRDDCEKDELAAAVARHFDGSLEVEEDESIVSFMQRIRNGEKSVVRHRIPEKDRKGEKKRKQKSSSRKRQRDATMGVYGGSTSSSASQNGSTRGDSTYDRDGKGGNSMRESKDSDSRTRLHGPPSSTTKSGSSGNAKKGHGKKDKTTRGEDNELYCVCNLPSYGNMIACDGKKCPNPSQWYHLECVGFSDGHHPDTWLCPECDPKGFQDFKNKKKRTGSSSSSSGNGGGNKARSKSPATK